MRRRKKAIDKMQPRFSFDDYRAPAVHSESDLDEETRKFVEENRRESLPGQSSLSFDGESYTRRKGRA